MEEIKGYTSTTIGHDGVTYETRAELYFEDGMICVGHYEYFDENQDWQPLDEREELEQYLNENYTWEQL